MQFFVENAPAWTTFDPATGRLEGTPGEADVGAFSDIRISVTDVTTFIVENLSPGTWYFAVTARAQDGLESAPSREASKRIDG